MGKHTGFMEYPREDKIKKPVNERIQNYKEFETPLPPRRLGTQAARCMDCGVPFCNWACPVSNLIPEFNEFVYLNQWKAAFGTLQSTNNFPEFTGRVCPAPCEASCCSGVEDDPISIKQVEVSIIEMAFEKGWVKPYIVEDRTDKKIAIIGAGPAGMAAASQLNQAGHNVTIFEKNEKVGGLLRFGIPDYKLEKHIIERRAELMRQSGIQFKTGANIGVNVSIDELKEEFDVICLTGGSEKPRDLDCIGRDKKGIHFAMDFLTQQNRRVSELGFDAEEILATGKNVVVIGGGDTGADCVGTSIRQGAESVTQLEILPMPPKERAADNPWPQWPNTLKTASSHEEGCERVFSVLTQEAIGGDSVEKLKIVDVEWTKPEGGGRPDMKIVEGSEREIDADLVLLAMGFVHPVREGMLEQLGVELDQRGNVKTNDYQTSVANVFAAGDMATGQSLIVRAIDSGRKMAMAVDIHLKGYTDLK